MKHDDMGMGLKSCVAVYLLELVRLLLQYKWGNIFRSEWFWMMEENTKRNGKGAWLREIEKVLKRFDVSLEWLMERMELKEEEMEMIRRNVERMSVKRVKCCGQKGRRASAKYLKRLRLSSTSTSTTGSQKQGPHSFFRR